MALSYGDTGARTGAVLPDAAPVPTATVSITPPPAELPDMSLRGQTWGWVIPITAGNRTIPGRPVWRRVRKGTYNNQPSYFLDAAISFGWRAERTAGADPVTLSLKKFVVNGVVLRDVDAGLTAPGVTVTFYDGSQTTADPFMVSVDGAADVPAYVEHILVVCQNIPLLQFGNAQPDAFAIEVTDSVAMDLPRALTLLVAQTRELKGRATISANITDAIDSLFIVEQMSALDALLKIGRLCDFVVRENNRGLDLVRAADGTVDAAYTEADLIRARGGSGLQFARAGDDQTPAEIRAQIIASEATFRFSERPARRDFGPMPTTTATRIDTIRVPLGMPVNVAQTFVSLCLYRETEARDSVQYALPWKDAVKVQPGDVHTVPDGDDLLTVQVARADLQANRTMQIQARRLHTTRDYAGAAIDGETLDNLVATPVFTPSFLSISGAEPGTVYESAPLTIADVTDSVAISIVGGEYSINGGAFTSDPGTVANGDVVVVRVTSSANYSTAVSAVLTVDGRSGTFSVATQVNGVLAATEAPDTAAFTGTSGAGVSGDLAATEAPDVAAFTGSSGSDVTGSLAATEAPDSASFSGSVTITGSLAASEAPDSAAFSGSSGATSNLLIEDGSSLLLEDGASHITLE